MWSHFDVLSPLVGCLLVGVMSDECEVHIAGLLLLLQACMEQ